jgi:hypothetical protein
MWFVLAVLATWRVTHLLANEDGPADLVVRLRAALGDSFAGKMMDCFNCLSLWVAAPVALVVTQRPLDLVLTWLALSGAACLLERLGRNTAIIRPVAQEVEGDTSDGMLWSKERVAQEHTTVDRNADIGPRN